MEKVLYKKDSKDNIRIWKIYTNGSELIQESGLLNGKLVPHSKICKAKNIGKSNETTPEYQAELELESEYKSKLDEGYFLTIDEAKYEEVILPMLAKSYKDHSHKIDWSNCYVQPKLDGMRCLAHIKEDGNVTLISRDGKIIENMNHIINDLKSIKNDIILDGELYAHGLSFQENMKLIKKYRKGETEQIKYHIYDIVLNIPFRQRTPLVYTASLKQKEVEFVDTHLISGEKEMLKYHNINLSKGYEGSIIRWGNAPYKINGRSENLLKYKDFQDISLKIIDIVPSEQRPEWGQPIFEINGKEFSSGMKFSHKEREEFLINKKNYIGQIAEVRFFEYSDEGVPRFPVMVGFRNDKTKQDESTKETSKH